MYFNDLDTLFSLIDLFLRLNPYCNGCTSMIEHFFLAFKGEDYCLNPYCNGCTSMMMPGGDELEGLG